jgi:hypothetical protein
VPDESDAHAQLEARDEVARRDDPGRELSMPGFQLTGTTVHDGGVVGDELLRAGNLRGGECEDRDGSGGAEG